MTPEQKVIDLLIRTIKEIDAMDEEMRAFEAKRGLVRSSADARLVDRMERLGFSKAGRDRIEALLGALGGLAEGRPIPPDISRLLAEDEAAERSADAQLAALRQAKKE
jgi:hypothetical protein